MKLIRNFSWLIVFALLVVTSVINAPFANAGVATSMSDTLSTMKQSVGANHTLQFTSGASDQLSSGGTITITFPTGFDLTALSAPNDFDLRIASTDETLQSAACSTTDTVQVAVASQTVTFTACNSFNNTAEPAGSTVIIKIGTNAAVGATGTHQIVNQTAAQNVTNQKISIAGGMGTTGTFSVEIIADNTVAVTGTVDPTITCTISANSAAFGTFTVGSVATAGTTPIWTISTNAAHGYLLTVQSAGNSTNAGLYSLGAGYVIKSADSAESSTSDLSVTATIGYGLQGSSTNGDSGSATTSVTSPYTSTSTTVGRLQLTAQSLASATGPVSNATVTSTLKAKVTGLVPAGSYVDTLTYVCTGTF